MHFEEALHTTSKMPKLKIVAPKPFEEDFTDDEEKILWFEEEYETFIWEYYDPHKWWLKHKGDAGFILIEAKPSYKFTEAYHDESAIRHQKKYWLEEEPKENFKPEYITTRFTKKAQEKWGMEMYLISGKN